MRDARLLPPSQGDRLRARHPVARRTHLHLQRRLPVPARPPPQADQRMERETAPRRDPPVDNTIRPELPERTARVPHLRGRTTNRDPAFPEDKATHGTSRRTTKVRGKHACPGSHMFAALPRDADVTQP